jgi:hypothetical protein
MFLKEMGLLDHATEYFIRRYVNNMKTDDILFYIIIVFIVLYVIFTKNNNNSNPDLLKNVINEFQKPQLKNACSELVQKLQDDSGLKSILGQNEITTEALLSNIKDVLGYLNITHDESIKSKLSEIQDIILGASRNNFGQRRARAQKSRRPNKPNRPKKRTQKSKKKKRSIKKKSSSRSTRPRVKGI